MANLSNINGKFLFTDGDFLKIGNLAPINNISSTESGISVTNGNCASITLDNSAAQGKTFSIFSAVDGSLKFYDVDASSNRLVISTAGDATVGGNITAVRGFFNSGSTNVVATFTSTDGIATLQCVDSAGNVEFGASGNNFVVQPAGGVVQLTVGASSSTFAGDIMPSAENLHDIGSASVRWEDIWADQVYGRDVYVDDYIYHNGDTNTYIRAQADKWTFRTGGDDRVFIENSGSTFTTQSTIFSFAGGPQLRFLEPGSSYSEAMRIIRSSDELGFHYGGNANEEAFIIDKDGNSRVYHKLGIRVDGDAIPWRGTAQIPAIINLAGNGALFTRPDQTFLSQNFYYNASDVGAVIDAGQASIVQCNAGEIVFSGSTAGASSNATISIQERMRIKSDGNILVADTRRIQFYNTDQYIGANSTNDLELGAGDDINYRSNFSRFFSGTTEHCRVSGLSNQNNWIANGTGGKLGIGITNPQDTLHVNGDAIISSTRYGDFAVGSLNTTGYAIANVAASTNGQSAIVEFVASGNNGAYYNVVYSIYNGGGVWYYTKNVVGSGGNIEVAETNGSGSSTLIFYFRSTSGSAAYTPRVMMKASPYNYVTF